MFCIDDKVKMFNSNFTGFVLKCLKGFCVVEFTVGCEKLHQVVRHEDLIMVEMGR